MFFEVILMGTAAARWSQLTAESAEMCIIIPKAQMYVYARRWHAKYAVLMIKFP